MMNDVPSGGELISAATETAPLPPGLFSTTTDWPTFSCSRRPMMRATVSGRPPAPAGMMNLMGWLGYTACARAGPIENAPTAVAPIPISTARRLLSDIDHPSRRILYGQH